MFPFVFKLWRYHGLPRTPDVPGLFPVPPAAPAPPVASQPEAEIDERAETVRLLELWRNRYVPALWTGLSSPSGSRPRRILAVNDGSDAFRAAVEAAELLARRWGCAVVESPVPGSVSEILSLACGEKADWIVVGRTEGEGRWSVEDLVKTSDRHVLVVSAAPFREGVRRILIPVDGTPASLAPVAEGMNWAREFGAELLVFHVREDPAGEVEHRAFLDLLKKADWDPVGHETVEGEGDVAGAILGCAEQRAADLILMGTHRSVPGFTPTSSRSLEVLRGAGVPLMIVHPYD